MDSTALEVLHHPPLRSRKEQEHLERAGDWNETTRHVLLLVHVLRLVYVVRVVDWRPAEEKIRLQFSRTYHIWKMPHVTKPINELNIKRVFNITTVFTINKIMFSSSWNGVHHNYCGHASNWLVSWALSLFLTYSVLALFQWLFSLRPRCCYTDQFL